MPRTRDDLHGYDVVLRSYRAGDKVEYLAEVPDLPGCMSPGETPSEAVQNLPEAIEEWIKAQEADRMPIPEPRKYSGRLTVRLPRWLHRDLALKAEVEGVPLNQYIISLLARATARTGVETRVP